MNKEQLHNLGVALAGELHLVVIRGMRDGKADPKVLTSEGQITYSQLGRRVTDIVVSAQQAAEEGCEDN